MSVARSLPDYADSRKAPEPATRQLTRLERPDSAAARARLILLRAVIWGVIGLIYAPLFVGVVALLREANAGPYAYVVAAMVAGGAGAVLYSAREVGLLGTGVGLFIGATLLLWGPGWASFEVAVAAAAGLGALLAASPVFPGRCGSHLPAKALTGCAAGALGGTVIAIAEPCHPAPFSCFAVVAFLASINGVLYVAGVRRMVHIVSSRVARARPCNLVEALVVALLGGLAAGSLWVIASPLDQELRESAAWLVAVGDAVHENLPFAILGGIFGGAVAGALLELFRFRWVHDL